MTSWQFVSVLAPCAVGFLIYLIVPGPPPGLVYAFLTHTKTGTVLCHKIACDVAPLLDMKQGLLVAGPLEYACGANPGTRIQLPLRSRWDITCNADQITVYGDYGMEGTPTFESVNVLEQCTNTRAVHMIRRPSTMLVSEYAYNMRLSPGHPDYMAKYAVVQLLQNMTLSEGMQEQCKRWFADAGWKLEKAYQKSLQGGMESVLQVKFEDFMNDFDQTARAIFQHFLGNKDSRIDHLVEVASRHDIRRMTRSTVNNMPHVGNANVSTEVTLELKKQFQAGNSCMRRLAQLDEVMGYGTPF